MGFLRTRSLRRETSEEKFHVLVTEDLQRRLSYFSMSCVVLVFINLFLGLVTILMSLRAHRLLNPQASDLREGRLTSWLVAESRFLRAKRLGVLAFALNCCGIVLTMCGIIFVLMYFGTAPEQRTSVLSVIASFVQCKSAYHPALARTSTASV